MQHILQFSALLPPQLTVNPPVITETDSVTLNCQTPSSASVTECYFRIVRGGTAKSFPCLQTLTGSELLKMSNQSSPAEVKVTCFYLKVFPSPDSDMSSIIIRTSRPPKLTVNPPVINETDSVTLNCEAPSSASVPLCSFFTSSGGTVRFPSCLQTLTGSELLKISQQRSPAEVQVTCFYTVKLGAKDYPSPHSDTSSITIHNSFHKIQTQDIVKKESSMTSTDSAFTKNKDLTDSRSTASTFGITGKPVSDVVESNTTQTKPVSSMTTGVTVSRLLASTPVTPMKQTSGNKITDQTVGSSNTGSFISTSLTPVKPTSETWTWKFLILAACLGGVFLLGLALLCTKRRFGKCSNKRSQANVTDDLMSMRNLEHGGSLPADAEGAYSTITSVAAADCPTGSEKLKEQAPQNEDVSEIYTALNIYSTISEQPPASALEDMVYSTLQPH
ncbi:uncharacterized protein LOC116378210 isoform X2 [Anarrhichthys ocellatus]|uniref:uncharacterized protein LOC116378210 isoform X2 n=1 Tax=Anarrhichthys ocellatus TaxID=433405 RepID=UPI0012ECEB4B|nr:uncharacterized protein LOC116378210 isoform X2 [Anarrhichthys ocellatus]